MNHHNIPRTGYGTCTLGALAQAIKTSGIASPSVTFTGDMVSGLAQAAAHFQARHSA
ncbi:hypothetical protein RCH06_001734 [Polaromonas sp. CG_9.5]|uniref:hypothetical protein n=1 Tax=Polaromonas sp. CG_9.5 TaxID=3071705 RepID=UPI002E098F68|nr:hypothetical protein [Polaromonas sp. CG_9.5]